MKRLDHQRPMRHLRKKLPRTSDVYRISCLIGCCVIILLLAGCQSQSAQQSIAPPVAQLVTFTRTTSYAQALREITDLGMQPGVYCGAGTIVDAHTTPPTVYRGIWEPRGQRAMYERAHQLYVVQGAGLAYPGAHLVQLPGVLSVQNATGYDPHGNPTPPPAIRVPYACVSVQTVHAATPVPWGPSQPWLVARITFTSPLTTYDDALYIISDLGLGLADPCYEQKALTNSRPTWKPMGQENAFASTHTLVVQTNNSITSSLWRQQLQHTAGITAIQVPYQPLCG